MCDDCTDRAWERAAEHEADLEKTRLTLRLMGKANIKAMNKIDAAKALADSWDHSEHESENEEHVLKCYHESHSYFSRPSAPCQSTRMANELRSKL